MRIIDIGGRDVLSYKQMLQTLGELRGQRRLFLPSPVSNIAFYSYAASLFTPVPAEEISLSTI